MKFIAALLLLFASSGVVSAQTAASQAPAPTPNAAPAGAVAPPTADTVVASPAPFLWQISVGNVTHYLLGSVHLLPKSVQPLPPALDKAYAGADTLVFESDLGALDAPAMQRDVLAAARGKGLRDEIPPALYERVQARARRYGLADTVCDPYAAWFCAMTLEIFSFQQQGFDAATGLDQYFYARAANDNKTVAWFEAPSEHLRLFTEMDADMGRRFLASVLDEDGDPRQQPTALLNAWRAGDIGYVEQLDIDMKQQYPALYERLLAARNRAWLPVLAARLKLPGSQMIIVGAAHLVGPDGLVPALRLRGFDVRRVDAPAGVPLDLKLDSSLSVVPPAAVPHD
ncbi:TraB/GumN family protein [Solimonas terrae]|uniref:TraB/GumN family protein n=1 Tax=Solimonas terrae TaxID=1396819 RepID=A0A6M2BVA1_9GAMM|nr:TraB/GumN family protein [Solimonas terrae]NGY06418.1 TraB/GumN family protein [Solimonas terrae]